MAIVLQMNGRIRGKLQSWRQQDSTIADMCLSKDLSDCKITPKFWAESFGVIMLESILIIQFGIVTSFRLKRRYTILYGLTGNFLETIKENISLMHIQLQKKWKLVWVKKINIFGCYQYRNGKERQDI